MKTWINCDYILTKSEETEFLQELVISKNTDLFEAIEENTCHRSFKFTQRSVLNCIRHNKNKGIGFFYVNSFPYRPFVHFSKSISENYKDCYLNAPHILYYKKSELYKIGYNIDILTPLHNIDIFSFGLYRVYKNKIYKYMEIYRPDNLNIYIQYNNLIKKYGSKSNIRSIKDHKEITN